MVPGVTTATHFSYRVASQTGTGKGFHVRLDRMSPARSTCPADEIQGEVDCTCPGYCGLRKGKKHKICKHALAVLVKAAYAHSGQALP